MLYFIKTFGVVVLCVLKVLKNHLKSSVVGLAAGPITVLALGRNKGKKKGFSALLLFQRAERNQEVPLINFLL